jgi:diguanylate cyclase (GGDEF)-like protein
MVIDLDHFKQVNSSVGLAVGDSILLTIARRLSRLLKPQDVLARLGGDQFGLVLLSVRDAAQITAFAETLRKALRAPIAFNDREIVLTASIGVALGEVGQPRAEELLADAELATVHGKRAGGDRIEVFKPTMRVRRMDKLALETELKRAIEREQINLHYQPVMRLKDRAVAGFTAVLRWDHPRLESQSPAEFMALAAEAGLVNEISIYALERAARQLGQWQRAARSRDPVFVSLNVASRQLLRQDFVGDLRALLARASVARDTLKLELTEALVMDNPEYATQVLARMREFGAGLMLDDFGKGLSSLSYLQRFPFDTLKLDQSFVRPNNKGKRPTILRGTVTLAHDLGMQVVAEGVENDADVAALIELGCEFAQRLAFGEPMDAERAGALITREKAALAHVT